MKKLNTFLTIILLLPVFLIAQEGETEIAKVKSKPVRAPFGCPTVIDNQTVFIPTAKTLEFVIEHRFDKIENISNLFGIYGSSNIRLGVNYSITINYQLASVQPNTENCRISGSSIIYWSKPGTIRCRLPLPLMVIWGSMPGPRVILARIISLQTAFPILQN